MGGLNVIISLLLGMCYLVMNSSRWHVVKPIIDGVAWTNFPASYFDALTHWGRVTHICVGKLTTICSDNGLSPGRRQAFIWTIAGILLIGPLGTNFSEVLIGIFTFSIKKMSLKVSSAKWRSFCLGLNVLMKNMRNAAYICHTTWIMWWLKALYLISPRYICF